MGDKARHDPAALSIKDEVRRTINDVRRGSVSPGAGSVMLQGYRLLRELEADERLNDSGDTLMESIQVLRASGVPDASSFLYLAGPLTEN